MQISTFSPDERDALLGWIGVRNAVRKHDSPWVSPLTEHEARGLLTYGWDLEPDVALLGTVEGVPVAAGAYTISERDNLHLAWTHVEVHPEHRLRGYGTSLHGDLVRIVAGLGRTSVGVSCWESADSEVFALRLGYARKQVGVNRRQVLSDVDLDVVGRLHADAVAASGDYVLVRSVGRSSKGDLDATAVLTAAINDAPTGDLDIEDEVFDAERIRAYETAQISRGGRLYRLSARHRGSGELAGHTVVVVDGERPQLAEQHDTSVLTAHRGHRLGALLKTGMLQWLRVEEPQVVSIETWNAEENSHMIGVNDALGYQVLGRELNLQKSLDPRRGC